MVGNEPFSHLVISVDGRQWRLRGEAVSEISRVAQGQLVRITGTLSKDGINVETWTLLSGPDDDR